QTSDADTGMNANALDLLGQSSLSPEIAIVGKSIGNINIQVSSPKGGSNNIFDEKNSGCLERCLNDFPIQQVCGGDCIPVTEMFDIGVSPSV
ncbi:hypothetical protein, partial [Nitrobacter vulgaris]|uniref:hypothetical protein n=1 Tax=Nitrobacter vulgaris TaxID=29421 RepID=UPI001AECF508